MMRTRSLGLLLAALLAAFAVPRTARANGAELLPGGTQSVARGGAVAARPENAMALEQNPAGMALLRGDQLLLNIDLPLHDMCVDPYGYYGWGVYDPAESRFGDPIELDDPDNPTIGATYASSPLPKVCNSGTVLGIPHIAWVGKFGDDLAIGAGLLAPTLITGFQFGGGDGTIDTPYGARPTPTRYQFVRQQVKLGLAPIVGVAYRVHPILQVGLATQIVMLRVGNRAVQNLVAGTQPSSDSLVDVDVHDYFVPAVTLSVHAKPIAALDVMASFRWSDKFDGSGTATYETNTFHDPTAESGPVPFKNAPVALDKVQVGLPWTATIAARYAGLLSDAEPTGEEGKGLGDPMDREQWDVEVDAAYNFNARASRTYARAGEDAVFISREAGSGGSVQTQKRDELDALDIDRHLEDSIALRAGGSFSVLPRTLAVEAGAFYETRGVEPAYVSVDTMALARFGFGLGLLARFGDFDLMAAYGHIFQDTLELAPPDHEPVQNSKAGDPTRGFDQRVGVDFTNDDPDEGVVLRDPAAPSASKTAVVARLQPTSIAVGKALPDRVINAGKYTAAFNIISIGAVYHF